MTIVGFVHFARQLLAVRNAAPRELRPGLV
jgi:hypothetical protein